MIRFSYEPDDEGVIAPPVPAKADIPDWFRKLPAPSSISAALRVSRPQPHATGERGFTSQA